jgi:putative DNA-invertase from lambdoid prophage Rac
MLAGVLEFQRDMISENTKEGVAAAEAAGKSLGRPAALDEDKAADAVDAYAKGAAVKALARQYDVAPKTIRRVLDAAGARDVGDVLEERDGVAADVEHQEWAPEPQHPHHRRARPARRTPQGHQGRRDPRCAAWW